MQKKHVLQKSSKLEPLEVPRHENECSLREILCSKTWDTSQGLKPPKNVCFYKNAHNSAPWRSPDMRMSAVDVKFCPLKHGIPPEAWDPKKNKMPKISPKKCNPKGAPARAPPRAGSLGGGSPPARKIIRNPRIRIPDNPCGLPLIIPVDYIILYYSILYCIVP